MTARPFVRAFRFAPVASALLFAAPLCAQTTSATEAKSILRGMQSAFSDIADKVSPCVVTISGSRKASRDGRARFGLGGGRSRESTGSGSGVIVRSDGWILTNDHVVGSADRVTVKMENGQEFSGRVVRDFRSDLALVKLDAKDLPVAKLGDSDGVKVGHWAIAVGSPYGYEGTVSVGIVSSLHRRQTIADSDEPTSERFYPSMLQTDAAINPGNSGGPLFNLDGEVIGINTAIESETGGSVGIGFAIPINAAKFVMKQLMATGKVRYGYLGVEPAIITPRLASTLKVEKGAFVQSEPRADTPAAKAGIHAGDVVTVIDGKPVRNDIDLRTIVSQTLPGASVQLTVIRSAKEIQIKAILGDIPRTDDVPDKPSRTAPDGLGLEVITLSAIRIKEEGMPRTTRGVIVQGIDADGSAADNERIERGLVILKVNDRETPDAEAYRKATANLKSGDTVRLLCLIHEDDGSFSRSIITVNLD